MCQWKKWKKFLFFGWKLTRFPKKRGDERPTVKPLWVFAFGSNAHFAVSRATHLAQAIFKMQAPHSYQLQGLPSFESVLGNNIYSQLYQSQKPEEEFQKHGQFKVKTWSKSKDRPRTTEEMLRQEKANLRERKRTVELNRTFELLRKCILERTEYSEDKNLKSTKVVTLRLAAMHIDSLHRELIGKSITLYVFKIL